MKDHVEWNGKKWQLNHKYKVTRQDHSGFGHGNMDIYRECRTCGHQQFNAGNASNSHWIDRPAEDYR